MGRHHIQTEPGDANGTPAGLRISWAALAVLITTVGSLGAFINFIRLNDVGALETQIATARGEFLTYKLDRESQTVEQRHQLDRIESAISELQKSVAALEATSLRRR